MRTKTTITGLVKIAIVLALSLWASAFKPSKNKSHICGFGAGKVVEFVPKDQYEIYPNAIYFNKGHTLALVDSTQINKILGTQRTYPLSEKYHNDSCGKTTVGIPVGRRQYIVCEVEPKICGSMMFKKPEGDSFTDIIFLRLGRQIPNGLVKIKDKDIYFIVPGF